MAHCDGCVSFLQEIGDRSANNVAAAENNSSLSFDDDFRFLQKHHNTLWSTGNEIRLPTAFCKLPNVQRLEAVNILERRYS